MYPQTELTRLAQRRLAVRHRIAERRIECVAAATEATRPLVWLDQVLGLWRQLPPLARLAALPVGGIVLRSLLRHTPRLLTLLRWAPLVLGLLRRVRRPPRSAGGIH